MAAASSSSASTSYGGTGAAFPASAAPGSTIPPPPGVLHSDAFPSSFEAPSFADKDTPANGTFPSFGALSPLLSPLVRGINYIHSIRKDLNLPNPGSVEHLQREVKSTHLTNFMFDGARADLTRSLSLNPIFQVTHAFSMGSAGAPAAWNFGAVMGNDTTFLQGGLDDQGSVSMRANQRLGEGHIAKVFAQFASTPGQTMVQLEHDYVGQDHSANIKAFNPSPNDFSGIYMANFLQSFTRNFAFGIEGVYQRPPGDLPEASIGYVAKWTSDQRDAIATLQLTGNGVAQATYWQRLAERVDVAADLQVITAGQRRDAIATLGAKWDFRMSTFRTQLDSSFKVSSLLETRLAPTFAFTVGGEIDHMKGTSKFGVGVALETAPPELQEAAMGGDPNSMPPSPRVPM